MRKKCPSCGQVLEIEMRLRTASHGSGAASGFFAMGEGLIGGVPRQVLRKPILPLGMTHFALAGITGLACSVAVVIVSGFVCAVDGSLCLDVGQMVFWAILAGVGGGVGTLRFIDGGRYEVREELGTAKAKQVAPMKVNVPVQRIELAIKRPNSTQTKWFDLPPGIQVKHLRNTAKVLQEHDWKYSRPRFEHQRALTQTQFHKLTELFKAQGLVRKESRKHVVTPEGKLFFKQYWNPVS